MNKKNRLMRIGAAAVLSLLMAASCAQIIPAALGLSAGWTAAWPSALAAVALCALASWSGAMTLVAALCAAGAGGLALWTGRDSFPALRAWAAALVLPENTPDAATLAQAGMLLSALIAVLLAAALFVLLSRRSGSMAALLIYLAVVIVCYALAEETSFGMAVPGLVAALCAFACAGGAPRDSGVWRAAIPAVLAVCVALLLVPSQRLTWEPLERAAQTVREMFEDYFRFTQERISFTISTEGYNHAAEVNGDVVTRLGGPATPNTDPVMEVTADADVLLRGSIRRIYTGDAWIDTDAKARYLYYDFTRSGMRERLFGMYENDGFAPIAVQVKMLDEATSALFVPGRMEEFSMSAENAVHYNSIGEMFLSRRAQAGDAYAMVGYQPEGDALRAAVLACEDASDNEYDEISQDNLQLPEGVEEGVYALTVELTRGCANPYDKAAAIQSWLRNNCVYTLEPGYPEAGRDFVSQFVLEDREGYCSYFASAMTVMCRIAGLPARYVEGYSVKGGEAVVLTGEDAHAWTEVYFNGLGWVAFDPANGAGGGDDGMSDGNENHDQDENANGSETPGAEHPDPTPTPEPTTEPTLPPDDRSGLPESEPTPSPTPDSEDFPGGVPENTPQPSLPPETDGQENEDKPLGPWLWILLGMLLLLLLLALAVLMIRARLAASDPMRMSAKAKTAQEAALMLYRAILTLLAVTGQAPVSGETPGAFARRTGSEAFTAFADALALSVYAREGADRQTVELGRRAYAGFLHGLRRGERLRFNLRRLMKGIGSIESIP